MSENNHDEIDLISLMLHLQRGIKRHGILIIIILLLTTSAAVAYRVMQPPVYENEMALRSKALDRTLAEVLTKKINKTNTSAYMRQFEMTQLNSTRKEEDLVHDNYFSINVHAADNEHWDIIQQEIVAFLSHKPSVKNRPDSLASSQVVEVIDNFAGQGVLLNKGLKYYVGIGFMMGVVLAFIIVSLIELKKYLKNYEVRS